MNPPPKIRVRIRFSKAGKIRFVSHRDVARLFERALRKLRLSVAYSEGFSPRPKLSFGLALSVAHESDAEYLDVEFSELPDLEGLPQALSASLPEGIEVDGVQLLLPGTASLQEAIVSCDWRIEVLGAPVTDVSDAVAAVLAAPEIPLERERKGKTTVSDVRPAILDIEVEGPTPTGVQLVVKLATETVSLRPAEVVRVLGVDDLREGRVRRTHQWINVDGERCEPVSAAVPSTGHDELRRAS